MRQFARIVTRSDVDNIRNDVGALDFFTVSVNCLNVALINSELHSSDLLK